MPDQNRIAPNYQEMAKLDEELPQVGNAASPTQQQLLEMSPGERWAHEAAQAVDRVGGNQGAFTSAGATNEDSAADQAVPEATDRKLDHDGEFGYPTPT